MIALQHRPADFIEQVFRFSSSSSFDAANNTAGSSDVQNRKFIARLNRLRTTLSVFTALHRWLQPVAAHIYRDDFSTPPRLPIDAFSLLFVLVSAPTLCSSYIYADRRPQLCCQIGRHVANWAIFLNCCRPKLGPGDYCGAFSATS